VQSFLKKVPSRNMSASNRIGRSGEVQNDVFDQRGMLSDVQNADQECVSIRHLGDNFCGRFARTVAGF
jgi:hypothetical protein